jgi:hypothetical protein
MKMSVIAGTRLLSMSMLMRLLPSVRDGDEEIETEQARYTKTTWEEWNQVSTGEVSLIV